MTIQELQESIRNTRTVINGLEQTRQKLNEQMNNTVGQINFNNGKLETLNVILKYEQEHQEQANKDAEFDPVAENSCCHETECQLTEEIN